jgi:hypothetical protein
MVTKAKALYETNLFLPGGTDPLVGYVTVQAAAESLVIGSTTNAPPTTEEANTTQPIRVSGTKKYGITARHIVIARIGGTTGSTFREYRRIVIFTTALFETALSDLGLSVSYEGLDDWFIVGGQNERYRLNLSGS